MAIQFSIDFEQYPAIDQQSVAEALSHACQVIKHNLSTFTHSSQMHSSINNFYQACENDHWTSGFWTGTIWLAYENTQDEAFKESGLVQVESFNQRILNKV